MNKEKVAIIGLGFLSVLGLGIGFEMGSNNKQFVYDTMSHLLHSEQNTETVLNVKALVSLRDGKVEEVIDFTQIRVKAALNQDGIKESTIQNALEYQNKFCKNKCLGLDDN